MKSLSSVVRTPLYVFLLCGIFVSYLIVTSQQDTNQAAGTQYNAMLLEQMQVPLPARGIQDLQVQQARNKSRAVTQIQPRNDTNKVQDDFEVEAPEGSVDTRHPESEVQQETSNSLRQLKERFCEKKHPERGCLIEVPEDIMQIKLPPFLKEYKNPCWLVDQSKEGPPPIRCLPYYFLIGAPKSGTTDLCWRIIQHPQMCPQVKKEIHWFTRRRFWLSSAINGMPHPQTFVNYTDEFKTADAVLYSNVDNNGYHFKIFGDSSVSTFWDNKGPMWESIISGTKKPKTAEYIHHFNPKTKFVSIIRDPVERIYSDYMFFEIFPDKSKEAFHNAVTSALKQSADCLKQYSLDDCISLGDGTSNPPMARLSIGIYYHHFQVFFKYFPRDQFIILKLEDYSDNLPEHLAKVFSFLDLDPLSEEAMAIVANKSITINSRPSSSVKVGDMMPKTRKLLDDFYRPFNDELGKLLGEQYNYNKKK